MKHSIQRSDFLLHSSRVPQSHLHFGDRPAGTFLEKKRVDKINYQEEVSECIRKRHRQILASCRTHGAECPRELALWTSATMLHGRSMG